MAYLTVNGVEVQCDAGASSDITPMLIGEDGRAFNGAPFSTERAVKGELTARTLLLSLADVPAWRGLLHGEGHVWTFDSDFASSRGLLNYSSTGTTPTIASGAGVYGGALSIPAGATWTATVGLGSAWTFAYWVKDTTGGGTTWKHWIERPGRFVCQNGVLNVLTPNTGFAWNSPAGTVRFQNTVFRPPSIGTIYIDGLVVLPYVVPDAWVSPIYTFHSAQPFPALPRVALGGDVVTAGLMPSTAMGRPGKAQPVYQGPTPTFSFEFTLRGV